MVTKQKFRRRLESFNDWSDLWSGGQPSYAEPFGHFAAIFNRLDISPSSFTANVEERFRFQAEGLRLVHRWHPVLDPGWLLVYFQDVWPDKAQLWDMVLSHSASKWHTHGQSVAAQADVSEYDRGKQYYEDHEEQLKIAYPEQYVAIWQDQVISNGPSFAQVAEAAYEQVGYRDIFMPKVGRPRRVLRMPTPSIRRDAR